MVVPHLDLLCSYRLRIYLYMSAFKGMSGKLGSLITPLILFLDELIGKLMNKKNKPAHRSSKSPQKASQDLVAKWIRKTIKRSLKDPLLVSKINLLF